jgi:hypothetical protein
LADTEKAIAEINELTRLSKEKLEQDESIGIDAEDVGELTIVGYKSVDYKKALKLRRINQAYLRDIDTTAPSELKQVLPLLEELGVTVKSKQTGNKVYGKIIDKFAAFGSWAKVVTDILHYTGHI